jgi:hypothetical protein
MKILCSSIFWGILALCRYFFADHQENIKKYILKYSPKTGSCFISIEGGARQIFSHTMFRGFL